MEFVNTGSFQIMNSTSPFPTSEMLAKPAFKLIWCLDNLEHYPKEAEAA